MLLMLELLKFSTPKRSSWFCPCLQGKACVKWRWKGAPFYSVSIYDLRLQLVGSTPDYQKKRPRPPTQKTKK